MVVLRAAVVGDYDREAVAHRANTPALELAAGAAAVRVVPTWIPTDTIDPVAPDLEAFPSGAEARGLLETGLELLSNAEIGVLVDQCHRKAIGAVDQAIETRPNEAHKR